MLIDSHCHLNFIDLQDFNQDMSLLLQTAREAGVGLFLSVCVDIEDYPDLKQLAERYDDIRISVGVHPNSEMQEEISAEKLMSLAAHPACIAIGETGLDYYRTTTEAAQANQQSRFREHIRAAIATEKPLIIHTRQAAEDTLRLMREASANSIGGVMHCFAEDWDIARRCLDMGFYISFSGILTFKNAHTLQAVAKQVPLDRILIETDSPYLAPVPFRGKQNHPALVRYVAEYLAELRGLDFAEIAEISTENFYRCFRIDREKK